MRIGIDLDDVLVDFTGTWTAAYNREFAAGLTPRDITAWDLLQFTHFGTATELWAWMGEAVLGDWADANPVPGALDGVRQLADDGHELVIITSKAVGWEWVAYHWLALHNVPAREVHVTSDKASVPVCDIYLDDGPHNLKAYSEAHPEAWVVRYRQPWNFEIPSCWNDTVQSWPEFLALVDELGESDRAASGPFPTGMLGEEEMVHRAIDQAHEALAATAGETRVTNAATGGEKGQKLARFDLLPWDALWQVAEHYGVGAAKYADHNWRRGYDWSLSIAALSRHLALFTMGEDNDEETGTPHPAAIVFHGLSLLVFMREHPELDDRYRTLAHRMHPTVKPSY